MMGMHFEVAGSGQLSGKVVVTGHDRRRETPDEVEAGLDTADTKSVADHPRFGH
jgi:hypothetical protein